MRPTVLLFLLPTACADAADPLGDSSGSGLVQPLAPPCGDLPVTALLVGPDGLAWAGCSHGRGVFRTTDAGASFEPMHASPRLVVNQLVADARGRTLLCGRDLASPGRDAQLLRYESPRGWRTLRSSSRQDAASCERVAADW